MSPKNPKVGMVSLGCPKALVDSERILTELGKDGYELVGSYQDADIVIVNTCGFIDSAKEESIEAIHEALDENGKVIVTGCLSKADEELAEKFPNLLGISGPQQYDAVIKTVHQYLPTSETTNEDNLYPNLPPSGIKLTPRHYAYLKISEGCNHKCSFCIIPDLRGKLDSRTIDDVLKEAETLINDGVKELLVVSQDTSAYGVDIGYQQADWKGRQIKSDFFTLCEELSGLGVWSRLHYVYPYPHVDRVIELMNQGSLLPYLDIPFQHANHEILKSMKRPASSEDNLTRIREWRSICPDLEIRSTFIVGFPGETEAQFESLLTFLSEARINRAGCFKYSPVKGARANQLPNQVNEDIKEERWHRLMQLQSKISAELLAEKVGSKQEIILDECAPNKCIGRRKGDAPEIDGLVIVEGENNYRQGDIVELLINASDYFDLYVDLKKQDPNKLDLRNI